MQEAHERRLIRKLKLTKVEVDDLGIRRVSCGRGFTFRKASGKPVKEAGLRGRISSLVIPPAWREVRIADDESAHIQAVGRDDAGRLQYIYHPDWEHIRAARKIERLIRLGGVLPTLRQIVAGHLGDRELSRPSILAAAVTLLDRAVLRAGHEAYAGEEGGRGAATLLKRHATVSKALVDLDFRGKGGRRILKSVRDPLLARKIDALKSLPGARLFKERNGRTDKPITAEEINAYLQAEAGSEITAKDFRTFHASARALELLCGLDPRNATQRKKALTAVCREVANLLQNTPAVCRSSYIHATVLDAFEEGTLTSALLRARPRQGLSKAETGLMRFLEAQT